MKFKKLEIYGFKSFADKLEVKYGSGITAIVGPNGCGKSNVADAIRWVLGEQSAKLLRGSNMQDVIFNGTEKRKSLSFCQVSLYFDNAGRMFPSLDYDEVVISRKLYRSGESEYAINKNPCRLKDITELLRDGGMGREGYSIIGQGRIDELLSAKPEDRRTIFEEAAGISKFKARKTEAERKLIRTRDNFSRIDDILAEKRRFLEPLTKQAETAKKWLVMRDRLKHLEINKYIYQFDTASIAKATISKRLNSVVDELSFRQNSYETAVSKYNDTMNSINTLDKTLNELRERHLALTIDFERRSGEIKVFKERAGFYSVQNDRLHSENAQYDYDYNEAQRLITQGRQTLEEKKVSFAALKTEFEEKHKKYLEIVDILSQSEDEVQVNYLTVLDAADKLSEIKSNMSRLLAEKEALAGVVSEHEQRISRLSAKIEEQENAAGALEAEISEIASHQNNQSENLSELNIKNGEIIAEIESLAKELEAINTELYTVQGRRKLLKEMHDAFEGFAFSVKKLINDAKVNSELSSRIEGLVAQVINVGAGFELAIETALGGAVQNIITKNEDDAKYLIEYLKRMRYGRATFLPITSMKPRNIEGSLLSRLRMDGCYGIASDIVNYDKKYTNIVKGLLGSTVVVNNMDTAIKLARETGFSFRIVTLEGDVISPQGSLTGGSKKAESSNVFAHDRELKELEERAVRLTSETEALKQKRQRLVEKQRSLAALIADTNEKLNGTGMQIAEKRQSLRTFREEIQSRYVEIAGLSEKADKDRGRICEIEHDINSVGELEQIVSDKKYNISESNKEKQQQFEALRLERAEIHEQSTNLRVKISATENEILSISGDIERLEGLITAYREKIDGNNAQIQKNDDEIKVLEKMVGDAIENSADKSSETIREIKDKLNNLDKYKQELQAELSEADASRQELTEQIQRLLEKKNQEEFLLQKVDIDIEQMQERISEEYDLTYEDCLPFKEDEFNAEAGSAEITKLSRQMHALGSINIEAIEQSREYSESCAELEAQCDDLKKGEADLVKIIKELSCEMLERFSTQFEQIRANFVKIFKELFDGGTADLLLLENENPLEAGIEIVAQPPQKKLQSISLLSGGERALTAIAILFAILRLKPMPFCVLDEIEAALDDANAHRFAKYLRRFSEETQFIVITHRKPTMELADNLYGVTMEEKGVSKIVSVKLCDVIEHSQEAMSS